MDDPYVCYGCGLVFPSSDFEFDWDEDDPSAMCPECGSKDIESAEDYEEGVDE